MKIQHTGFEAVGTTVLHNRDIMDEGYTVEFSEDGSAIVQKEVGEALAERYPNIEIADEDVTGTSEAQSGESLDAPGQAAQEPDHTALTGAGANPDATEGDMADDDAAAAENDDSDDSDDSE